MKDKYDIVVVGGGPAGLAAAFSASENGAKDILLLERQNDLGGILNQCIHNGFGLHYFNEELTGPEYAERFIDKLAQTGVTVCAGAMVLEVGGDKTVHFIHPEHGYKQVAAQAVILSMGCRERTRGAIGIPGTRPAGIYTAGAAQLYMNIEGYKVGKRVVILGSGDIGLIMARRMVLEGAEVLGVYELMPYSSGLNRNIVQCLQDYDIPLHLSHTITDIKGYDRLEQVVVQQVDENSRPIAGTEQTLDCDTLLLSVGLIPENELTRQAGVRIDPRTSGPFVYENMETSIEGIFACGNVAHVHDLVDFVTMESMRAGKAAAEYCAGKSAHESSFKLSNGEGVTYTVPQEIRLPVEGKTVDVFFRVNKVYKDVLIKVTSGGEQIARYKREHMAPGEMEKIALPVALMGKIQNGEATISIGQEG